MKKPALIFWILVMAFTLSATAKDYHISVNGSDHNPGTLTAPFKSISAAARIALPGDKVIVHEGTYREWIRPANGGLNDLKRIVYEAAPGEKVIIKGSEVIKNWEKVGNGVWKVTLPNSFFGDYNPYQDSVYGDWFYNLGRIHHTGEVYLNEKSLYEVVSLEAVKNPKVFKTTSEGADKYLKSFTDTISTLYQWYCESDDQSTTIWANFHEANPNKELVEINVRKACFYPEVPGKNYITVRGFHMSQAATQWAPPTAEQIGLIGTHYSKGWIIENNTVSNSKCAGISLGKDRVSGQNVFLDVTVKVREDSIVYIKGGTNVYNEVIFRALDGGWSKEKIGSHIVRNNEIFDCEQAGIVGSLGGIFSEISNNYIHDIWTKRIFDGAEIGGIKIHGSIDMLIRKNRIHNTGRGMWLDWMAQGTRVTGNILYDNSLEDLFMEVNHGPYMIDNNVFLSELAIKDWSEGGAFAHNLIYGKIEYCQVLQRWTPNHQPHSTKITGINEVWGGDNRFYNNIFVKRPEATINKGRCIEFYGLENYHLKAKFPNVADGNVYLMGAKPGRTDTNTVVKQDFDPQIKMEEISNKIFLSITIDNDFLNMNNKPVTTELLGTTLVSEAIFDNPDGSHFTIDTDFLGVGKDQVKFSPGPFGQLKPGVNTFQVW